MDAKAPGYVCPRCTVGRCLPQRATFADVYHGHLLCVPNLQAFKCDVCHFIEFERESLDVLWHELYGDASVDDAQSLPSHQSSPSYREGSN